MLPSFWGAFRAPSRWELSEHLDWIDASRQTKILYYFLLSSYFNHSWNCWSPTFHEPCSVNFSYGSASQVFETLICDQSHLKTLTVTWQWQVSSLRSLGETSASCGTEQTAEPSNWPSLLDWSLWYKSKWKQSQAALGGQVWLPPHPSIIRKCCVFAAELKVGLLMIVSLPDEWPNEQMQKHHTRDQCYNTAARGILQYRTQQIY